MPPGDGRSTARSGAWAVSLLLLGPLLAGCLADPSTQISARRGDFAEIELLVADGDEIVFPAALETNASQLCGQRLPDLGPEGCPSARAEYVLLGERPAHVPERFENASALPDALVDHVQGLSEGEHRLREDVRVWGPHREGLVVEHDRRQPLPRLVDDPSAYGREWNTTRLEDGSHRIEPSPEDLDARLEVSDWCNERFCLFGSRLVDWNQTHLVAEHEAEQSQAVHVDSLDTDLAVVDADEDGFTIDGNHPRAGESFSVYARLLDVRGPSEGQRRAPSFQLTTLDGQPISLEEQLGKPLVLEFFATWCPSCRENAEHLAEVDERFGSEVNIVSIGVDPWESSTSLSAFVEEHNVTWPVAVDERGEVSNAYRVGTLSTEVIVDAHGVIRHVETGVADHERVVSVLEHLIEDRVDGEER